MRLHVAQLGIPVEKLLGADVAGVWTVAGVEGAMLRQMVMSSESFSTHVAFVGTFA
jgi:hypothetical protein